MKYRNSVTSLKNTEKTGVESRDYPTFDTYHDQHPVQLDDEIQAQKALYDKSRVISNEFYWAAFHRGKKVDIILEGGYLYPQAGGGFYEGRFYTEHALERMAPNTSQVMSVLIPRIEKRAKHHGINVSNKKEYDLWLVENGPQPRGITPSEIESALESKQRAAIKVVTGECGVVITAYRPSKNSFENGTDVEKVYLTALNINSKHCSDKDPIRKQTARLLKTLDIVRTLHRNTARGRKEKGQNFYRSEDELISLPPGTKDKPCILERAMKHLRHIALNQSKSVHRVRINKV